MRGGNGRGKEGNEGREEERGEMKGFGSSQNCKQIDANRYTCARFAVVNFHNTRLHVYPIFLFRRVILIQKGIGKMSELQIRKSNCLEMTA